MSVQATADRTRLRGPAHHAVACAHHGGGGPGLPPARLPRHERRRHRRRGRRLEAHRLQRLRRQGAALPRDHRRAIATAERFSFEFAATTADADDVEAALIALARELAASVLGGRVVPLRRLLIGEASRFPEFAADYYDRAPGRVMTGDRRRAAEVRRTRTAAHRRRRARSRALRVPRDRRVARPRPLRRRR